MYIYTFQTHQLLSKGKEITERKSLAARKQSSRGNLLLIQRPLRDDRLIAGQSE